MRVITTMPRRVAPVAVVAALAALGLSGCSEPATAPAAVPHAVTIAVPYCTGLEPTWVAFQDGNGAWAQAQPTVSGGVTSFPARFSTSRGGLATVTLLSGGLTALAVRYGTPTELATAGDTSAQHCGVSKTLFGTVAGLDTNEFATINAAYLSRALVLPGHGNPFTLEAVSAGPQDVVAVRTTRANGTTAVTRFILRRGLDLPDSTTLPVLDFASTEAFEPAMANVSLNGLGSEYAYTRSRLLTNHSDLPLTFLTIAPTDPTRAYYAVPEAKLLPTDLQVLEASVIPSTASTVRAATLYFRAPTDRVLTVGAPLVAPTFSTVATAPALRVSAQFAAQPDYDQAAVVAYQEGNTTLVSVSMTAAYAAVSGAGYTLIVPDLSAVAGFNPAWALRPGTAVLWTAVGTGGTLGAIPREGAIQRIAENSGTLTP